MTANQSPAASPFDGFYQTLLDEHDRIHARDGDAPSRDYQWLEACVAALSVHVHRLNVRAGWWHDLASGMPLQRNVGELLMLATSELAEAMEGHRKSLPDDKLGHFPMFDVELADCLIRLFDMIGGLHTHTAQALPEKLAYNFSRPDHQRSNRATSHGKKY